MKGSVTGKAERSKGGDGARADHLPAQAVSLTNEPQHKELSMRLTTKGRFAVTAMIDLALRQNNGPVTLAAISQRQQISCLI